MAKETNDMVITGQTPEGKLVYDIFKMVDTHGLPLEIVLDVLTEHNALPDWVAFYEGCFKQGMKPDRILLRIEIGMVDFHPHPGYRETVMGMMNGYVKVREKYRKSKNLPV